MLHVRETAKLIEWRTRKVLAILEGLKLISLNSKLSSSVMFSDMLLLAPPSRTLEKSQFCKDGMVLAQYSLDCVTFAVSSVKTGTSHSRREDGI